MKRYLVWALVILALALTSRCEHEFETQDPDGYAQSLEEAREEGIPDPRR